MISRLPFRSFVRGCDTSDGGDVRSERRIVHKAFAPLTGRSSSLAHARPPPPPLPPDVGRSRPYGLTSGAQPTIVNWPPRHPTHISWRRWASSDVRPGIRRSRRVRSRGPRRGCRQDRRSPTVDLGRRPRPRHISSSRPLLSFLSATDDARTGHLQKAPVVIALTRWVRTSVIRTSPPRRRCRGRATRPIGTHRRSVRPTPSLVPRARPRVRARTGTRRIR